MAEFVQSKLEYGALNFIATVGILCCLFCHSHVAVLSNDTQEEREVSINVIARNADGAPLVGIPVCARIEGLPIGSTARTNDEGRAVIDVQIHRKSATAAVSAGFGAHKSIFTGLEQREMAHRLIEYRAQYAFDRFYPITIAPDAKSCFVELTAYPAVKVRGVVAHESGQTTDALIWSSSGVYVLAIGRRPFALSGVRRDSDAVLYALSADHVIRRSIDGNALQKDLELGPLTFPSLDRTGELKLMLHNLEEVRAMGGMPTQEGATLVHVSGDPILTYSAFPAQPQSDARRLFAADDKPWKIPSGEYFVLPGVFQSTAEQRGIIEAIHDGRNLMTTHIPRVNVKANETTEASVDLVAGYKAINTFLEKSGRGGADNP